MIAAIRISVPPTNNHGLRLEAACLRLFLLAAGLCLPRERSCRTCSRRCVALDEVLRFFDFAMYLLLSSYFIFTKKLRSHVLRLSSIICQEEIQQHMR